MRHRHYHGPDALPHTVVQFHARGPHGTQTQRCKKTNRTGFGFKQRHPHRHVTGRDRMGLPTLQPLQDPILLPTHGLLSAWVGFGTGRQKMALERWTNPKLSRRTCTCEYGLQSGLERSAGSRRKNGLVSALPPEIPGVTIRNFSIAVRSGKSEGSQGRRAGTQRGCVFFFSALKRGCGRGGAQATRPYMWTCISREANGSSSTYTWR